MKAVKSLLMSSNYWVVNKLIVKEFGIEAAFLLSVFVEAEELFDGEWFYQTAEQLKKITGLTKYKQTEAIKTLTDKGIIIQRNMGMPRKRYFKINYDKLLETLNKSESCQSLKNLTTSSKKIKQQVVKKFNDYNINNIDKENNININANFEKCFDEFYERYPRKLGKAKAKKKYISLLKKGKIEHDKMLEALRRFKQVVKDRDKDFIPYCSTWVNSQYLDYYGDNPSCEVDRVKYKGNNLLDS